MMIQRSQSASLPLEVVEVRSRADAVALSPLHVRLDRQLSSRNAPLVLTVIRDERHRLADFLRHYRSLGVGGFVCVDNGSTDGSQAFLAAQPDVDLWSTDEVFSPLEKHAWINRLIDIYGRERWYLLVDADEQVVYAGAEHVSLGDFANRLFAKGLRQARGMLVDMYAAGAALTVFRSPDMPLIDTFPLFDASGYDERRLDRLTSRRGGPRARAFESISPAFRPELTKYPLFWPEADSCMTTPHYNFPRAEGDEDVCRLGILHFKFDSDSLSRVSSIVSSGRYWNASFEYQVYRDAFKVNPSLSFDTPASRRYESPQCLVAAGLIAADPEEHGAGAELGALVCTARRAHRAKIFAERTREDRAIETP